ncbi:MAG: Ldh family oxidoreductase [Ilumatobacteraceae bacterium]
MTDVVLSLEEVEALAHRLLRRAGASELQATPTARSIRDAEADGIRTVGLAYLPAYLEHVRIGKVVGTAVPVVTTPRPATVVVDAGNGFCHPAFLAGEAPLVEAARAGGIATMALVHSYSAGVVGWFVERLADAGLVAMMFANTSALLAPYGGRRAFFGTNPMAWAAPRRHGSPVVADLSASAVAWVTVDAAARAGTSIPLGWAIDADGEPTTDPQRALGGAMSPAGGHKGSAWALLVEVLAGGLAGPHFSHEASNLVGPEGGPPDVGQIVIALDPGIVHHDAVLDRLDSEFTALAAEAGARLPGTRRLDARISAQRDGVRVPTDLLTTLENAAGP